MEPVLIVCLGVLSMIGQLNNYGIDVRNHPHLKDVRVRRDVDSEPNFFKAKDQSPENASPDIKKDLGPEVDVKDENSVKNVQFIIENDKTNYQPSVLDDTDQIKIKDDVPEDGYSVKSVLKGEKPFARKERQAYTPTGYPNQAYGQAYNGYDNGYNHGYTGYNNGNNQGYSGYNGGNNQGYTGYNDGYNQGYTGYNNGYNQGYTGYNNGYNQGYTGYNNGYTQGINGYNNGYNSNANRNNQGHKDIVDKIVDNAENLADSLLQNSKAGSTSGNTGAYNQQSSTYPDGTVYSQHSDSVYTYGDKNLQGITLTNTNIHVVEPKRNKSVIHKNSPRVNLTIITDVPANIGSHSTKNTHSGFDRNKENSHQNRNNYNDDNSYQITQNHGVTPDPLKAKNHNTRNKNSGHGNGAKNTTPRNHFTTKNGYYDVNNDGANRGSDVYDYNNANLPRYGHNNANLPVHGNNNVNLPGNGYNNPVLPGYDYTQQYYRKKRSPDSAYYKQMKSQMAAAAQQINQVNSRYGTHYHNPYNDYTTKSNSYEVSTVTEAYNKENKHVTNKPVTNEPVTNEPVTNEPVTRNSNSFTNSNNVPNNSYNANTYSPYNNDFDVEMINETITTTTPKINQAQIIINFNCPKFLKGISIMGTSICVPDDSGENSIEDSDEYI